jgi:hypothetical protein
MWWTTNSRVTRTTVSKGIQPSRGVGSEGLRMGPVRSSWQIADYAVVGDFFLYFLAIFISPASV